MWKESFWKRLRRWWARPSIDRKRRLWRKVRRLSTMPFSLGCASLGDIYLSYHPDSQVYFDEHPEFWEVLGPFLNENRVNNAGDLVRLWTLIINIKHVLDSDIKGNFAELGVYRGNVAAVLALFASRNGRRVQLFDTFQGFDARDYLGALEHDQLPMFDKVSIAGVRRKLASYADVCDLVPGYFPDSLRTEHDAMQYAVVSIDCDLQKPTTAGLEYFYRRMPKGGVIFVHDYSSLHWKGVKLAVDEFCRLYDEQPVLIPDKSGTVMIRRSR